MDYKQFMEDILKQYNNEYDIVKEEDIRKITNKLYASITRKGNCWLNNAFQSFLFYFKYYEPQPITVNDIRTFIEGIKEWQ